MSPVFPAAGLFVRLTDATLLLADHGRHHGLQQAAHAAGEPEETGRLFLLPHGHPTRPLTPEQASALAPVPSRRPDTT
ncbi:MULTISPECIES: hypothetical protein [Streptomyces]|uniref:Uncharacterized protein n=1 Tax=Streptomyces sp. NBC_00093 TaxID=2975649 RepID=A0AAU2ADC3_9ACTN